ncbi:MAG: AAA family ATPase [Pseudomonadales bacterium]|nr:AAA family ATPase [Halioglobus sp.]MCP5129876.1 AAA family ATPase [Pseudomonadales bacterium]
MYEHFFRLKAEPFRLSPDHRFCYNHPQYAKAKAYMAYAFMRAEGFVMVTGQPGTGKTTLIGDLVESLADENVVVANLVSTQLAADDLLRMVAFSFGLTANAAQKSAILQDLSTLFLGLHREGGRALLIVDEAQDLTPMAMEELRLLTNLQLDGQPLLQIFLLGQPELRELIHSPELEQVHQRIIATSNLRALELDETRAYVEHRLRVVGWRNDPAISAAVFPIIYQFSEGVPRRINLICSRLLLHTFVEQRHRIGVADARTVVQELQDEQLSTRNLLNDDLFYAEDIYEYPPPDEPEPEAPVLVDEQDEPEPEAVEEAPAGKRRKREATNDGGTSKHATAGEADESRLFRQADTDTTGVRLFENLPAEVAHADKSSMSMDAWAMLFAGLVAGGFVLFFVGVDRIL